MKKLKPIETDMLIRIGASEKSVESVWKKEERVYGGKDFRKDGF